MEKMLQRDKRSAIVFVSNLTASNFFPGYATYGASKSYVDFLAVALAHENKDKMDIMSFQHGPLNTPNLNFTKDSLFTISTESAAKSCLGDLGYQEYRSYGHFLHDIYAFLMRKSFEISHFYMANHSRNEANRIYSRSIKKEREDRQREQQQRDLKLHQEQQIIQDIQN
jgi:short-subunit dehydrogenase